MSLAPGITLALGPTLGFRNPALVPSCSRWGFMGVIFLLLEGFLEVFASGFSGSFLRWEGVPTIWPRGRGMEVGPLVRGPPDLRAAPRDAPPVVGLGV